MNVSRAGDGRTQCVGGAECPAGPLEDSVHMFGVDEYPPVPHFEQTVGRFGQLVDFSGGERGVADSYPPIKPEKALTAEETVSVGGFVFTYHSPRRKRLVQWWRRFHIDAMGKQMGDQMAVTEFGELARRDTHRTGIGTFEQSARRRPNRLQMVEHIGDRIAGLLPEKMTFVAPEVTDVYLRPPPVVIANSDSDAGHEPVIACIVDRHRELVRVRDFTARGL